MINKDIQFEENLKLLENIEFPSDLRKLPIEQLPEVCKELRQFMIQSLSVNPGHFASSMGAVEISVALHYVFNTPYDRIVWDVGHQAYSHKILTGRRTRFNTNRKLGGLSGFPNPAESEYDTFSAGHASNSISAALGMALASTINKEEKRRNVVAVIGDASISGGLAFEGLNNAASNKNNLLIILNDNDMAIDQNVGGLNEYMTHLNTSKSYNTLRFKAYMALKHLNIIDDNKKSRILRFNNSLKALLTSQQNIFEGLNIRYFGPFDGNDISGLVKILRDIKDMEGPRILHLRTRKGKGYKAAEDDPITWHAPGKFNIETGKPICSPIKKDSPIKFQDVFGHTIVELADNNPAIAGITAAMSTGTSLCYMIEKYPERSFDVGISEGHAVTFAGGLAKEGLKPFCCIYSSFLQRAYDEIIHDIALQNLSVTFCLDRSGLVGEDGATHHGAFDLAYLRTIPNMTISAPRNEHYLRNLMFTAQSGNYGPFAIRYPRGKGKMCNWHNEMEVLKIGQGEQLREGRDIAILSIGTISYNVETALDQLTELGYSVAHFDMVYLKPIDETILEKVSSKYKTVVTIEDGTIIGGLGSAVMEWCNDNNKDVRIIRMGIPDNFIQHATVEQQYQICGIDAEGIKDKLISILKENNK